MAHIPAFLFIGRVQLVRAVWVSDLLQYLSDTSRTWA